MIPKEVQDIIDQQAEAYPLWDETIRPLLREFAEFGYSLRDNEERWIEIEEGNVKTYPKKNYGVLVFIPEEDGHITSGMWDVSEKWVLLDEYRTVGEGEGMENCKVTHWQPLPKPPST